MLRRTFGCIRVVWNYTLATRHAAYVRDGTQTSHAQACKALTAMKADPQFVWLNEVSAVPLQQALRSQQRAFRLFFEKRNRYPRFKVKGKGKQTAAYMRSAFRIKDGKLWLAKTTEPLQIVWSWPEIDIQTLAPSSLTVSLMPDGRWFVSFSAEIDAPSTMAPAEAVGVDLGLTTFAVLSTGERIDHPHHMTRREQRLKRYQRVMARRKKGSANRAKARRRVARQHSRVADARRDFLHKTSTDLIRRFDVVVIEDLPVQNIMRNRHLSQAVSRTGWGTFRSMLAYKAERRGQALVVIDRWYPSSKTCSECGYLLAALALKTRHWTCPSCGTLHDRDLNAAKNIRAAGLAVLACGGDVRRPGATLDADAREAGILSGACFP